MKEIYSAFLCRLFGHKLEVEEVKQNPHPGKGTIDNLVCDKIMVCSRCKMVRKDSIRWD